MELHAVERELAVAHGHHLAVGRRRGHLEDVGHRRRGERVVAAGQEVRRQAGEDAAPVVGDERRLAVHELARLADLPAEDLDERLVAEAHAERRDADGTGAAGSPARACILWPAGARGDDEVGGGELLRLVRGNLVVAADDNLGPELAEQVSEVVGERVVVVDQQDHARLREIDCRFEGGELAQALLVLGARVAVGDDAAPACRSARPSCRTTVRIAMHASSGPPGRE